VVTTTGLVPVSNWKVAFTVYLDEANSTKNGFADLLAAQAAGGGATSLLALQTGWPVLWIKDPGASTLSEIINPGNLVRGGSDNNVFTYTIPAAYTNGIGRDGTEGYINFNLNYTPVAKTAAANWQSASGKALSKFFTVPQWIIRNGVNDNPQNAYTNFEDGNLPSGGAAGLNWNGSVPFTVAYVRGTPPDGWTGGTIDPDGYDPTWRDPNFPNYQPPKLFLSDGVWDKIDASGTPAIGTVSFKADGTFDSAAPAQWYYTVKVSEDPPVTPSISAYFAPKSLVNLTVKGDQTRSFPFPISYASGQNYDAWVIAVKDYVVSKPLFISGAEGNLNITWGWGN
jgi:hypothetical protein